LTGASVSLPELLARAAALDGRRVPRAVLARRLRWLAFAFDQLGALGLELPLSREALRVMDGSTYVYRSDKARRELGWEPGDVDADLSRYLAAL
jgi:dihydroflavonol-4-reductase